jgi:hypothetical protein
LRRNAIASEPELRDVLHAQDFACPTCDLRIDVPGDEPSFRDAIVFRGDGGCVDGAFCSSCAELVAAFHGDPERVRRVIAHLERRPQAPTPIRVVGRHGSLSVRDPRLMQAVERDEALSHDVDQLIENASRRERE